jgi:hypothetical protein
VLLEYVIIFAGEKSGLSEVFDVKDFFADYFNGKGDKKSH